MAGAFLIYELIVGDWVELICQLYLFCFDGVRWFGDLTGVFAGVFGKDFFRGTGEGDSVVPASPPLRPSAERRRLFEARVYGTAEAVPLSRTGVFRSLRRFALALPLGGMAWRRRFALCANTHPSR